MRPRTIVFLFFFFFLRRSKDTIIIVFNYNCLLMINSPCFTSRSWPQAICAFVCFRPPSMLKMWRIHPVVLISSLNKCSQSRIPSSSGQNFANLSRYAIFKYLHENTLFAHSCKCHPAFLRRKLPLPLTLLPLTL